MNLRILWIAPQHDLVRCETFYLHWRSSRRSLSALLLLNLPLPLLFLPVQPVP